jgi:hypothetical protein
MIDVNATKYRTVASSKFKRSFPSPQASAEGTARRPDADAVASELAAGKGGAVPQSVAAEDAAASPDINVAHCHEGSERPAGEFSPGKDTDLDLRDRLMSSVASYVRDMNQNWQRGVDAFMNVGRLCAEANARLTAADKLELLPNLLFGEATFSKFVRIGTDTRLQTPEIQRLLPPHYTTIYAVTLLTDEELKRAIAEKVLHPDLTRAQLQRWRDSHRENAGVAPSHRDAASDAGVVGLPIDSTQNAVNSGALPSTTRDDKRSMQDERAADPKYAPAPGAVATGAETKGPLTRPPGDGDIPAFLDRRPLSAEDQRVFDAIMVALNGASTVVRERVRMELMRQSTSSRSAKHSGRRDADDSAIPNQPTKSVVPAHTADEHIRPKRRSRKARGFRDDAPF